MFIKLLKRKIDSSWLRIGFNYRGNESFVEWNGAKFERCNEV